MKNPFGRAAREAAAEQEPSLSPRELRARDENERFMQQLYAGQGPRPEGAFEAEPPPAAVPPPAATVPPPTAAAVELLDIARQLLEGREDVESRVVRVLVGRALELLPRDPVAR